MIRGEDRDSGGPAQKLGMIVTRGHLSNVLKQCVDNSVILKMKVSSTEEQEKRN